jgi:uncharacterized LabA/DUF88 family protein
MRRSVTLGKIAVLLDGGFVRVMLSERLRRKPEAADVCDVVDRLLSHALLAEAPALCVLYYDAPPLRAETKAPVSGVAIDLSMTAQATHGRRLLDALSVCQPYAVRLGDVRMSGWQLTPRAVKDLLVTPRPLRDDDFHPVIEQKGVDIRIGLDIAWLATRRLVDGVVLVTADTDFVPAPKLARREGLSVVLATLGRKPHNSLRAHSDYVIDEFP